ncbi:MAG: hypothetical protein AAB725_01460 [Patescibacteria group bacterium]
MSNSIIFDRKNYNKLLRKQNDMESEVSALKEIVFELSKDEVKPAVVKRLESQSKILDKGGGKRFLNLKEFKNHLKNL